MCNKGLYHKIDVVKHMVRYRPNTRVDKTESLQRENVSLDGINTEQNTVLNTAVT
jgi:hypothetical protein